MGGGGKRGCACVGCGGASPSEDGEKRANVSGQAKLQQKVSNSLSLFAVSSEKLIHLLLTQAILLPPTPAVHNALAKLLHNVVSAGTEKLKHAAADGLWVCAAQRLHSGGERTGRR